jgi:signal transduction histidine kinase
MNLHRKIRKFRGHMLFISVLIVLLAMILFLSIQFKVVPQSVTKGVNNLNAITYQIAGGKTLEANLPATLSDLEPRTPVTVYAKIGPTKGESLRVETIYTALRLYADDKLIYECGKLGSYPSYLIDPPTIITMVKLPDSHTGQTLRFEYKSPTERQTISLPVLEYGDEYAIFDNQLKKHGLSFLISVIFILFGGAMTLVAQFYSFRIPAAGSFVQLGIFSFTIGMWAFGECPFTALIVFHPATLYLLSYCGLFLLTLPFIRFLELTLRPHLIFWFKILRYILCVLIAGSFILQITGIASLARFILPYEIVITAFLSSILIMALYELIFLKNQQARLFISPTIVITFFALVSFLNYELRFVDSITLIFQVGALVFLIQLTAIGLRFIKTAADALAERALIELFMENINSQLSKQREQYMRLAKNTNKIRDMRHDLRHQIRVLTSYGEAGDLDSLKKYLQTLSNDLDQTVTIDYCRNYAVNSIVSYYVPIAESEGVSVDVRLDIPEDTGRVPAADLCVIVGNLLENAIEALRRMDSDDKYIKARSRIANGTLSVIVENNFDGIWTQEGVSYISRKTSEGAEREGIGISSVKTVCEKYGGLVQIENSDQVWRVSAIIETA